MNKSKIPLIAASVILSLITQSYGQSISLGDFFNIWPSRDLKLNTIATSTALAPMESVSFIIDWAGQTGGQGLRVDNMAPSGAAIAIPEANSYALLGGLPVVLCVTVRRQIKPLIENY